MLPLHPEFPGLSRFGQTATGVAVPRVVLQGGGLTAAFLPLGATLQGLWLQGVPHSLTLGSDLLADYEASTAYPGALVGPVANRIAGASALVAGRPCRFEANEDGQTTLHSGPGGLHARHWRLAEMGETAVTFALELADGEGGFPGNRRITARYSLPGEGCLRLEISAQSDAPSPIAIANHSYWNLDGGPDIAGHRLQVAAQGWLPVDARSLPTGRVEPMEGAMDFRSGQRLVPGAPALDHNFCLAEARRPLTEAACLTGASGVEMRLFTTEPGLQVYDGRSPVLPGLPPHAGLAMEPQAWPDALHHPGFPDIIAEAGAPYAQVSEWRFNA